MVFQNSGTTDKRARGAQRFSAGVNDGENFGSDASGHGQAMAGGAMNTGCVGLVENQCCIVFFGEIGKLNQWCDVSIHAENAFGNDNPAMSRASRQTKSVFQRIQVQMRIDDFASAGQAHAINQAGMIALIGKHNVLFANKRGEQAKICGVAGGKK